jgi:hypothetical protein
MPKPLRVAKTSKETVVFLPEATDGEIGRGPVCILHARRCANCITFKNGREANLLPHLEGLLWVDSSRSAEA